MDVTSFRRRGGVDPKLIIALVVCLLGAGVFWWWNTRPDPEVDTSIDPNATYSLVCEACKTVSPVAGKDVGKVKMEKGQKQCPACKAFAAHFGSADELKVKPKSDSPGAIMP